MVTTGKAIDLEKTLLLKDRMIIQLMMCIRNAYWNKSLPVINHDVATRQNNGATFDIPIPRIRHQRNALFYCGSQIWNCLPVEIRINENKDTMKTLIMQGLIDNIVHTQFPF